MYKPLGCFSALIALSVAIRGVNVTVKCYKLLVAFAPWAFSGCLVPKMSEWLRSLAESVIKVCLLYSLGTVIHSVRIQYYGCKDACSIIVIIATHIAVLVKKSLFLPKLLLAWKPLIFTMLWGLTVPQVFAIVFSVIMKELTCFKIPLLWSSRTKGSS